jgi:hypothetical protein
VVFRDCIVTVAKLCDEFKFKFNQSESSQFSLAQWFNSIQFSHGHLGIKVRKSGMAETSLETTMRANVMHEAHRLLSHLHLR